MDGSIFLLGGLALIAYIIWRLVGRFGGPDKEFLKYYEEIISSDKYKVRRKNED